MTTISKISIMMPIPPLTSSRTVSCVATRSLTLVACRALGSLCFLSLAGQGVTTVVMTTLIILY